MKLLREFSYDFIDVDILSSSNHITRHLKPIISPFLVKKYDGGTKTVEL